MGCCQDYEKKDPFSYGIYPWPELLRGIQNPAGIFMLVRILSYRQREAGHQGIFFRTDTITTVII